MKVFLCIAVIAVWLTQVSGQYNPKCCMMACCLNGGQYQCNMGANVCFMGQQVKSGPRCGPGNNGVVCAKPEADEAEEDQSVGDSYWANRWLNNLDEAEDEVVMPWQRRNSWSDCTRRCRLKAFDFEREFCMKMCMRDTPRRL